MVWIYRQGKTSVKMSVACCVPAREMSVFHTVSNKVQYYYLGGDSGLLFWRPSPNASGVSRTNCVSLDTTLAANFCWLVPAVRSGAGGPGPCVKALWLRLRLSERKERWRNKHNMTDQLITVVSVPDMCNTLRLSSFTDDVASYFFLFCWIICVKSAGDDRREHWPWNAPDVCLLNISTDICSPRGHFMLLPYYLHIIPHIVHPVPTQ